MFTLFDADVERDPAVRNKPPILVGMPEKVLNNSCGPTLTMGDAFMWRRFRCRDAGIAAAASCGLFVAVSAFGQQYVSLTAQEFAAKASGLLNQEVEVSGTLETPPMLGPNSVGTFKDPESGKILVQLIADKDQTQAIGWLVGNSQCSRTPCPGVFARGRIVASPKSGAPVLALTDISNASTVHAQAKTQELVSSISEKDRFGTAKPVLPPHTVPTKAGWQAWADRVPPSSPAYDEARSMWDNMTAHAEYQRRAAADDNLVLIRGPERPADFETYYRSVRDTGLSNLYQRFRYQNMGTVWPRVAIRIEEKPVLHGFVSEFYGGKTGSDYCWRFRAKLWIDATNIQEIAPFNWCFSEARFNTSYKNVPIWGRVPHTNMTANNLTTGTRRTDGPVPPNTPMPDTPEYHVTFSYQTIMVGNVLLDMGFDYRRNDGRVWFLEDAGAN